jgi:polar amino acid transport system substrate-binding protein
MARKEEYMKKIITIVLIMLSLLTLSGCDSSIKAKVIDINLTEESYAYLVKKGNTKLVNDFNIFLKSIKEDGTFDAIFAKYFDGVGEKKGVNFISEANTPNDDETFVVATNSPFEPFEYIDGGKIYGIDIEIAQAYAESRNLKLVIKNINKFESILEEVKNGYADIGMAAITITNDRKESFDFTDPYYVEATQKLVVASDNKDFDHCKTPSDVEEVLKSLKNKKIGYQIGTTGNWYIKGDENFGFEGFANVDAVGYDTLQLSIQDITNGRVYAAVGDGATVDVMVEEINNLNSSWKVKWEVFTSVLSNFEFQKLIFEGLFHFLLK